MITAELHDTLAAHMEWDDMAHMSPREKLRFLTLCVAGEAGETANEVKKEWRGDIRNASSVEQMAFMKKVEGEVADVLNYAHMICILLRVDPHDIMWSKLKQAEAKRASK